MSLLSLLIIGISLLFTYPAAAQTAPSSVQITSPAEGTTVNLSQPIRISGTATNAFEGNVLVQIEDSSGRILASQPVIADGAALGGTGSWSVEFLLTEIVVQSGSIVASISSPRDGSIVASHRIQIRFQSTCAVRTDWPTYTVVRGDTAYSIARRFNTTVDILAQGNCLADARRIYAGQVLRLPTCQIRTDWPAYTVVRGDTTYSIARRHGTTVAVLVQANCLSNATRIYAGQILRVPQ